LTAASNADGAAVAIQPCTDAVAQKWTFTGGSVQIFNNKCLDVPGGSTADGTKLQIRTCTSNNQNQQFSYTVRHLRLTLTDVYSI
jgi:Ricin-type beta-trefoil lectin domain